VLILDDTDAGKVYEGVVGCCFRLSSGRCHTRLPFPGTKSDSGGGRGRAVYIVLLPTIVHYIIQCTTL
jgi:hypothetical protein